QLLVKQERIVPLERRLGWLVLGLRAGTHDKILSALVCCYEITINRRRQVASLKPVPARTSTMRHLALKRLVADDFDAKSRKAFVIVRR
ncbi:hypothetical protein, partial [Escherichia coli]|uniref:hypothetical protein n=1 Tax=Escherichia coli TaxID=562 RepID=UPI0019544A58